MKKKLAKSKKKKGTTFSLKDKIIMAVSVLTITTGITVIATKAAISLNPYPDPSLLLVPDTSIADVANNQTGLNGEPVLTDETATGGAGIGSGCGKSKNGIDCSGTCYCATDQYGIDYYSSCIPVNMYKGPDGGCTCPAGCQANKPGSTIFVPGYSPGDSIQR